MPTSQLTVDVRLPEDERRSVLVEDARAGLTGEQRRLSPIWFYDERGSRLFEDITRLPEYHLTRAERGLLVEHAGEIARRAAADTLVELGSGYSEKTRLLIDAMGDELALYVPLDVSEAALREAAQALTSDYSDLRVHGIVGDFHRHIAPLPSEGRRLVAFLGSTMGNLRPEERHRFLSGLRSAMSGEDRLLLGVDLVRDEGRLAVAYDDSAGVTADFNRNALRVLNHELGADFHPEAFEHVAVWNPDERWMEMRLRALSPQRAYVAELDLHVDLEVGEEILTEISAKFSLEQVRAELTEAGFVAERTWVTDPEEFALVLATPSR